MDRLHYIYIKYIPTYIYIYKYIYIYTYIYVYIDIIIRNVHMYNFNPIFLASFGGPQAAHFALDACAWGDDAGGSGAKRVQGNAFVCGLGTQETGETAVNSEQ